MPCPLARCYAMLPLLSSLVFFTQSAGWRGRKGGFWSVKHPTKEGMNSELCHYPLLIERLVVYTPLHTGEGANLFPQLLSSSWSFIAFSLWTKPPGEFFKLLIAFFKKT